MDTDCILWHKSLNGRGYGQTFFEGKVTRAHRAAWIKVNGSIPKGYVLDHICHTEALKLNQCEGGKTCKHRACINIEHLRLVTQKENIMSGLHNRDNRKTCRKGHPTIKENTMTRKDGRRECAECNRVRSRANWAKKAGK